MKKAVLTVLFFVAGNVFAQSFPAKPVRMIVPLVPGGNQDIVARAVAEELSKSLGQQVIVGYEADGENWKLSISDNGNGMPDRKGNTEKTGLGTSLVKALAQQLEAQVDIVSGSKGTTVSITHATFVSRLPTAA